MSLGGWAIGEKLYNWIRERSPQPVKILEMGSGSGSHKLSEHYNMHCIEHDMKWMNKYDGITYYHAPIVDGWYDPAVIDEVPKDYDMLLIDGPPGKIGRLGILNYVEELKMGGKVIIIDDIQRQAENSLFLQLWAAIGSGETEVLVDGKKKFGVIYNSDNEI